MNEIDRTRFRKLIEEHSESVTETGCWIWLRALTPTGYGAISRDGRMHPAHRIAFESYVSHIPEGKIVRHKCDLRCCVNPAHLELGSKLDNSHDAVRRDRINRKLTNAQCAAILADLRSGADIARQYGVSQTLISNIRRGKQRKHLHAKQNVIRVGESVA